MKPAEIRERADLGSVLAELEVGFERKGTDLWFRCRSGKHPDASPSCAMREEPGQENHGLVYCHSCKWSTDVFGLVMAVKGYPFPDSMRFVERHLEQNLVDGEEDEALYGRLLQRAAPAEIEQPPGVIRVHPRHSCSRYLFSRGFGWEVVDHFMLLDWRSEERLFVPIHRNGVLISFVARSYRDRKPKVLTPPRASGARWAMVNYDGLDRSLAEVHLTEGWASCARVWQAGFTNVVATCGSRLKLEQVLDLSWVERLVFWREGDHAGVSFFEDVLGWLGRDRAVEVVCMEEGKDPADYDEQEVRGFYNQRTQWSTRRRNNGKGESQTRGDVAVCRDEQDQNPEHAG